MAPSGPPRRQRCAASSRLVREHSINSFWFRIGRRKSHAKRSAERERNQKKNESGMLGSSGPTRRAYRAPPEADVVPKVTACGRSSHLKFQPLTENARIKYNFE